MGDVADQDGSNSFMTLDGHFVYLKEGDSIVCLSAEDWELIQHAFERCYGSAMENSMSRSSGINRQLKRAAGVV